MVDTADVVVVGGGVVGVSVAYHLAAAGAGRVVLCERADAFGSGATGACAGGFRYQFGSRINIELSKLSIPAIVGFTDTYGLPLDVHQDGYLFLVRDPRLWEQFTAAVALQRELGVPVQVLDADAAAALVPRVDTTGVVGATFGPADGVADPGGLTQGYATLARRAGAELRLGVEVVRIRSAHGRVAGVETTAGPIDAQVVVDAAGPWAAQVAATCGVEVPIEPVPRHVVVTGPFPGRPGRWTLVIDADTSFYFHREGDGVLMGMGRRDEQPSFDTHVDERFLTEELLPTAVRVFPPLAEAGVAHRWVGLYEMTPDRHPLIGETAELPGLYLAAGFSGHGFQHAPAVGRLLAELIVDGRAHSLDVTPLHPDRFHRGVPVVPESHVV